MVTKNCITFERINEIEILYEQESELSERRRLLLKPMLQDINLIPLIYKWFMENIKHDAYKKHDIMEYRKQFIMIILYLYSPQKLIGGKMKKGLRKMIVDTFSLSTPTIISNDCKDLLFTYKMYIPFKNSTDLLFEQILERLEEAGYIRSDNDL